MTGYASSAGAARRLPEREHETLRLLARRRATAGMAHIAGATSLYEVAPGWEAGVLADDPAVCRVENSFAFEEALLDTGVATIFIPASAAITLTVARRICARHGMGKTVFYEGGKNE